MSPLTPWIPRADANSTGLASQNMGKITLYRELGSQFRNPSDILSVLLLLAPEVVQRALAQLAGEPFAPVAFSFGWVGYSITTLFNIFGGMISTLSLMPDRSMLNESRVFRSTIHA
jgi:hypothetical protein